MKTVLFPAATIVLLIASSTVRGQAGTGNLSGGGYVGGSALMWELAPNEDKSLEATGFQFRFGNRINEYAAIESRFGLGGSDSTEHGEFELDLLGSLLISPRLPLNDHVELYGAFGFSTFRGTQTEEGSTSGGLLGGGSNSSSSTVSEMDITYGAGVALRLNEAVSIDADYTVYLDKPEYDFSGWSVGLTYYY